jgi:Raf kinase inhibitor-like YbhB/YbcL family protein
MRLESAAFANLDDIPERFTCEGADRSPPLSWTCDVPGTESLLLLVEDPDAPRGTWTHWIVQNLPPAAGSLGEGTSSAQLPPGASFGTNSWGQRAWGGPCPPGGRHRYVFTLYALDTALRVTAPTREEVLRHAAGHVIAQATLTATYQRHRPSRQAATRV